MYVCICNAVTDSQIRAAARRGVSDLWGLQRELGVAAGCGSCGQTAMDVIHQETGSFAEPKLYTPAVA